MPRQSVIELLVICDFKYLQKLQLRIACSIRIMDCLSVILHSVLILVFCDAVTENLL